METKQTSVEWFFEQLLLHPLPKSKDELLKGDWSDIFERAKQMEKQQIVNAVSVGYDYFEDGKVRWMGEQYYNETYKNVD